VHKAPAKATPLLVTLMSKRSFTKVQLANSFGLPPTQAMTFRFLVIGNGLALLALLDNPETETAEACFAIFEPEAEVLTFHRTAYDHFTAAEKVRCAGLPEDFGQPTHYWQIIYAHQY
jgi:hypothetical protein